MLSGNQIANHTVITTFFLQIGKNNEARTKPIIWIEAGIHAREWVAPATAVYTIHKVIITTYMHMYFFLHFVLTKNKKKQLHDWIFEGGGRKKP